jgi:Ser/Thr protein kinase RdoA (MazF antagonist)
MKNIPLKIAASLYGLSESDLHPMRGGHYAHVYHFRRDHKDYVLRLIPPNEEIDAEAQESILAWMACLSVHGASVPDPLPSTRNKLIEIIQTPEGDWMAMAFTRAEGILSEELHIDRWVEPLFQTLGKAIGRTHAIARDNNPPAGARYPEWDKGGNLFNRKISNEHWLIEKQTRVLEQIHALPKPSPAYGLIHGDLHFGNFFIDIPAQVITLIDFDDCAFGWFSMDIAILLFDVLVLYSGHGKEDYARKFLHNFLAGYQVENSLAGFWLEQLPLFLKLLEINVYDMVARFYPDESDGWSMKFMLGRKERLESDLAYVDLDFSAL